MAEINHLIGIKGTPDEVYTALSTIEGLRQWWSVGTSGSSQVGDSIHFDFGANGALDMKVTAFVKNERVQWICTKHADQWSEWIGTEFIFALRREGEQVYLRFTQAGWKEATDTLAYCSTKWAVYLLALKELIETGTGRPYPHDRQTTHRPR